MHPYVAKLNVTQSNCSEILKTLEDKRSKIDTQIILAESFDLDTSRLENAFAEISDCINDIKSWLSELAA